MSNQVILWILMILPWLTIFFMKKEDVKKFISVALLSTIISLIVVEVGDTLKWWVVKETAYPFHNISYIYSMNPVTTLWIFRFTYGRFWWYIAVEIVTNLAFSYLYIGYFLRVRDILQYLKLGPFHVFLITTATGILLYWFQKWQEGIFDEPFRNNRR